MIWPEARRVQAAILSSAVVHSKESKIKDSAKGATTTLDELMNHVEEVSHISEENLPPAELPSVNFRERLHGDMVEISISHDEDYAMATALFCDPASTGQRSSHGYPLRHTS
jgi:phosphopantetheinyl transferase (holo-ACP synthase)